MFEAAVDNAIGISPNDCKLVYSRCPLDCIALWSCGVLPIKERTALTTSIKVVKLDSYFLGELFVDVAVAPIVGVGVSSRVGVITSVGVLLICVGRDVCGKPVSFVCTAVGFRVAVTGTELAVGVGVAISGADCFAALMAASRSLNALAYCSSLI